MARTPEQVDAAITRIETILGSWTKTIDQLRPTKPPELPNGFYPIDKSMQQLYDSENSLNAEVIKLKGGTSAPSTPSPVVTPVPVPSTGGTKLSAASRDEVVAALRRNTGGIQWVIDNVERIAAELAQDKYSIADPATVLTVNHIIFGPARGTADADIIERYRLIIDPRDATGNPLPSTPVPSTTPAPSPTPGTSLPTLYADNVQFRANTGHHPSQSGITGEYAGETRMNGWDGGLRTAQNYKDNNFSTLVVPELPAVVHGADAKGSWSYSQFPKQADQASTSPLEVFGQSFIIDGGFGQAGYHFGTGAQLPRGVLLSAQRGGQSLYLCAGNGRVVGALAMNRVGAYVDGTTPLGGNPFLIFADGSYRRVKTAVVNGVNVLSF